MLRIFSPLYKKYILKNKMPLNSLLIAWAISRLLSVWKQNIAFLKLYFVSNHQMKAAVKNKMEL